MLEHLADIKGALEEADLAILHTTGMYGRESAMAWIWAALVELEEAERDVEISNDMFARAERNLAKIITGMEREAARWPAEARDGS